MLLLAIISLKTHFMQNFPVTPDLELPEGVNTVLLKKKGEGALPDGG